MAYRNLGTFLTKVTLKAISKLDGASAEECMRIAQNVNAWAEGGTITEAQLDELVAALPVEAESVEDTTEDAPDLDTMTKAELIAHADDQGIEVRESWTTAEIVAAIRGE